MASFKIRGFKVIALKPDYRARLATLRAEMESGGVDGLLVSDIHNIRYLSGFTGSSAYAVVTLRRAFLLTDPRYAVQSEEEVRKSGFKVRIYKKKPLEALAVSIKRLKVSRLGFEGDFLSYNGYKRIKSVLKPIPLKPLANPVGRVRQVKDTFEVGLIKKAASILESGFKKAERTLRAGITEAGAALAVEEWMRKKGAEGLAFESIVASGPRSSLPHGAASEKRIKRGDLVIVDMGACCEGYTSDNTRTYCIGRAKPLQKKIYGVVKGAQKRALELIGDGVRAEEVDRAARAHIEKAGYGKFFSHGTGHGLGLDVHERPAIAPLSKDILKEGMVVTIEPGIYMPDWGGVRIEDMALVRKNGCDLVTTSPDELLCL
ncbi:MAG: M24 family metallopeptidase [Thermodesulfobacteriota bacterium]